MDASAIASRLGTDRRVCVIGAGTMGSGIAAHLANLGFEVSLLDVSPESVRAGFDKAKAAKPPHFFLKSTADKIHLGSIAENIKWVSNAAWVCEAIIEDLDAKRALYAEIEPLLAEDALISTNTSGIELALLKEGRSESFQKRFVGTHFFNPPRYLKLLELIDTDTTDPELLPVLKDFFENKVGKRVVRALDTPGFIANRYGMWSMYQAIHVAEKLQMRLEDVDAITSAFLGRPKSGSFRLNDIVGLDVMESIAQNQLSRCPDDPYIGTLTTPKSVAHLIEAGHLGNKTGKGYYERVGKEFFALDFQTYAYRPANANELKTVTATEKLPIGERIREALKAKDEVGEFLRLYLLPTLRYADYLKSQIAYSISDFDNVMKWGFGWELGPFELIDAIGPDIVLDKKANFYQGGNQLHVFGEGGYVPVPEAREFRSLSDYPVSSKQGELVFRDLGDGVTAIEYATKGGVVSPRVCSDFLAFLDTNPTDKYILANSGRAFSFGFDLRFFQDAIEREDWMAIVKAISDLQKLGERLESFPIVAAIHGYSLGGGFELAMSCPRLVAQSDAQIGLPEVKVGLIPGGRGGINVRVRNQGWVPAVRSAIASIADGVIWANAPEALANGYLRETDIICFHPDRLIQTAKEAVLDLKIEKRPQWEPLSPQVNGMVDQDIQEKVANGTYTAFDEHIAQQLKALMCKAKSYDEALSFEQEKFLQLCQRPETKLRIDHMLETGKPLRN